MLNKENSAEYRVQAENVMEFVEFSTFSKRKYNPTAKWTRTTLSKMPNA